MTPMSRILACLIAALGAVDGRGARRPRRRQPPSRCRSSPSEVSCAISGDPGAAAADRRARFHRPRRRRETADDGQARSAQVLLDDLAFEREFEMIPRDTYASIPAAPVVRRRAVRSLARARRRRRGDRHRDPHRQHHPGRDAAVRRPHAPAGAGPRIQRLGRQPAPLRPHHGRRDPPDAERSCAAWRAPSWRSRRIATATAPTTTVRDSATSRRSTSPTTTAPTSAGSPSTGS